MFTKAEPTGRDTPTGDRLGKLLDIYLKKLEAAYIKPDGTPVVDEKSDKEIKRVNFIVITE